MDTVKFESPKLINIIDHDIDIESPDSHCSEDSESYSICEQLTQTGEQICIEDYPGQFNFDFSLDLNEMYKRHWTYSVALNKVYIDMNRVLPIQFYWHFNKVDSLILKNLRIRALLIFTTTEHHQVSIKRCPIHVMQNLPSDSKQAEHVIWCEQSDAIYDVDPFSQRHSVVAIVHNSVLSSDYMSYNVLYKFMCKSSCSMSLNRRPICVIFTLETIHGQVLGRKKLGLKVCSCPRRDMLREEETNKKKSNEVNYLKKRSIDISDVQSIKIKKNDNNDGDKKIYQIPKLIIPNRKLYLSTLELLHSHILGSAVRDDTVIDSHSLISMIGELITRENSENKADSENQQSQTNSNTK